MTMEQFKSLPFRELALLWKDYVWALGELLVQAEGDPGCPAGQRIVTLIEEVRLVLSCLMASNPRNMHSLRWVDAHILQNLAHKLTPSSITSLMSSVA